MKIVSLRIEPTHTWKDVSEDNPLKAAIKLRSKTSIVETVIPERLMQPLLDMVSGIVSEAAQENVAEFSASVSAVNADAITPALESDDNKGN